MRFILLLTVAWLAGCSATGYNMQLGRSYRPFDSQGVPVARGYDECEYQANLATAGPGSMADHVGDRVDLITRCMTLRGF
jgi:hypothetical protein